MTFGFAKVYFVNIQLMQLSSKQKYNCLSNVEYKIAKFITRLIFSRKTLSFQFLELSSLRLT